MSGPLTGFEFQGEAAATAADSEAPRGRILLVDDEQLLRDVGERILRHWGYVVKVASDGLAGWEELCSGVYDLVITDHDMPGLTGLALARRIGEAGMGVPVIMITGSPPEQKPDDTAWASIVAVVPKPFSMEALSNAIRWALGGEQYVRSEGANVRTTGSRGGIAGDRAAGEVAG